MHSAHLHIGTTNGGCKYSVVWMFCTCVLGRDKKARSISTLFHLCQSRLLLRCCCCCCCGRRHVHVPYMYAAACRRRPPRSCSSSSSCCAAASTRAQDDHSALRRAAFSALSLYARNAHTVDHRGGRTPAARRPDQRNGSEAIKGRECSAPAPSCTCRAR
jgi:hypothetical protein